jgi:putative transcriptional regulator
MKTAHLKINLLDPVANKPRGRINRRKVDSTTEADIARQIAEDDAVAMQDAARFAKRVRSRLGFSQAEFAERINVSLDTIRNWEQGKRCPTGAAKALLKVLDKVPEAALTALP